MEGIGDTTRLLTEEEIRAATARGLDRLPLDGRRVLVIVPDRTRTAPIPLFFRLLHELLGPRVARLDFLVALGTHPPLDDKAMASLMGISRDERTSLFGRVGLHNHRWHDPDTFIQVGTIGRSEIEEIAGPYLAGLPHDAGLLRSLPVTVNRMALECDHLIICGPTFPHEVAGFSGGTKYFFPGISGPEVIDYTHWLGAVVSSYKIIGTKDTPVRRVIDRAASFIERPKTCISLVVQGSGLAGLFVGPPPDAFAAAADLSSQLHIRRLRKPVRRVLSIMPEMYDDIWTAAKGMYKLEPVIEDGGEVVIYAPHIDEISYTHGRLLDEVGYHVSEYFLKQWERFGHYPGSILAHSTHLRGLGSYDAVAGVERPRIRVSLATRIAPERCRRLSLGYLNPAAVDVEGWEGLGEGYLKVPKAGELLYRLG
jgi:lactate racemase